MIIAPGAYATWVSWCEAFGRGEDLSSARLMPLGGGVGPELQERIIAQLVQAHHRRIERWLDQLQRDLRHVDLANPAALAQLLTTARARLLPLAELSRSTLLTADLRAVIAADLVESVARTQQELERAARRDLRTERLMLPAVRQYPLALGLASVGTTAASDGRTGSGRRVIL